MARRLPSRTPGAEANLSAFELKGELKATPDHAELPAFEIAIHSKGRSQMMKGKLALDFGAQAKAVGELAASWIDVDTLLAAAAPANAQSEPSTADVLSAVAERALEEAASVGDGALDRQARPGKHWRRSRRCPRPRRGGEGWRGDGRAPQGRASGREPHRGFRAPDARRGGTGVRRPGQARRLQAQNPRPLGRRRPRHVGSGDGRRLHASPPRPPSAPATSCLTTQAAS